MGMEHAFLTLMLELIDLGIFSLREEDDPSVEGQNKIIQANSSKRLVINLPCASTCSRQMS